MDPTTAPDDALAEQVLDLFAREARVDRALLLPQARADALGISSLDLTLALFELEDHFDIRLPDLLSPTGAAPTVGDVVLHVVQAIRSKQAGTMVRPAAPDAAAGRIAAS